MEKIKLKRFPITSGEYEKVFLVGNTIENRNKSIDKKICSVKGAKDYEIRIRFERAWRRAYLFLVFYQEDREMLLSLGKFGEGRVFDASPLPLDNYDMFCEIYQEEVIPTIVDRLYDLFGIKKEYLGLEVVSKEDIERSVEVA